MELNHFIKSLEKVKKEIEENIQIRTEIDFSCFQSNIMNDYMKAKQEFNDRFEDESLKLVNQYIDLAKTQLNLQTADNQ